MMGDSLGSPVGSVPDWGTRIPHKTQDVAKSKKRKKERKKRNQQKKQWFMISHDGSISFFFFAGCSAQLVGHQFSSQGLNPGLWQWDCEIQTTETAKEFPDGSISYGWFGGSPDGPIWGSQVAVFSWWISWNCHMGPLNSSSCDLSTWLPWASS